MIGVRDLDFDWTLCLFACFGRQEARQHICQSPAEFRQRSGRARRRKHDRYIFGRHVPGVAVAEFEITQNRSERNGHGAKQVSPGNEAVLCAKAVEAA